MSLLSRLVTERTLRDVHGWLGALILPWIAVFGLTGLYMNHRDLVLGVLPWQGLSAAVRFEGTSAARPVDDAAAAMAVARVISPGTPLTLSKKTTYLNRDVFTFDTGPDLVSVDRATGFAWLRLRYRTLAFAPDGRQVGSAIRWSSVMSSLHRRGWVGTGLGVWLADITATAMIVFALSGLVLFLSPRLRRRRNRRARMAAARQTEPA